MIDNESITFSASHDRLSMTMTLVLSGFFALSYALVLRNFGAADLTLRFGLLIAFLLIVALPYAMAVRRFEFRPDGLFIRYIIWEKRLPYYDISEIKYPCDQTLSFWRRVVGTYSYFGYSGKTQLGDQLAQVASNRRSDLIYFEVKNTPMLIGPDDPDEFVDILRNYISSEK